MYPRIKHANIKIFFVFIIKIKLKRKYLYHYCNKSHKSVISIRNNEANKILEVTKVIMKHQSVRLSFAARTLDEHTTNICSDTMQYDTLTLDYQLPGIYIECMLPNDAKIGDSIALSATSVVSRNADFCAEVPLNKQSINSGKVDLCLSGQGTDGEYVLQLNLLGIHGTVINSAEFNAFIKNSHNIKTPSQNRVSGMTWAQSAKRYAASMLTSIVSIF